MDNDEEKERFQLGRWDHLISVVLPLWDLPHTLSSIAAARSMRLARSWRRWKLRTRWRGSWGSSFPFLTPSRRRSLKSPGRREDTSSPAPSSLSSYCVRSWREITPGSWGTMSISSKMFVLWLFFFPSGSPHSSQTSSSNSLWIPRKCNWPSWKRGRNLWRGPPGQSPKCSTCWNGILRTPIPFPLSLWLFSHPVPFNNSLYETDLVEEEAILVWHSSGSGSVFHQKGLPFINWLQWVLPFFLSATSEHCLTSLSFFEWNRAADEESE